MHATTARVQACKIKQNSLHLRVQCPYKLKFQNMLPTHLSIQNKDLVNSFL